MKKQVSKFVTSQTYKFDNPQCFECIEGESQTLVGESYTVQELFDRYMQGQVAMRS